MRKYAKIDFNQNAIVKALRGVGASVQSIATIGKGCPDILVGFRSKNYLMEIKESPKSKLTMDEKVWHALWYGSVVIVRSESEALAVIGIKL